MLLSSIVFTRRRYSLVRLLEHSLSKEIPITSKIEKYLGVKDNVDDDNGLANSSYESINNYTFSHKKLDKEPPLESHHLKSCNHIPVSPEDQDTLKISSTKEYPQTNKPFTSTKPSHKSQGHLREPFQYISPPIDAVLPKILPLCQPFSPKLLKVALIGPANAGKSTLVNHLIGDKISITSTKPQTTRSQVFGILTEGSCQIIFYDTPGLAPPSKTHALKREIAVSPYLAMKEVDIALFIWDCANVKTLATVEYHLNLLKEKNTPIYFLLNKIDLLNEKNHSQHMMNEKRNEFLKKFPFIQRTFCISALHNNGLYQLKKHLISLAVDGQWLYSSQQKGLYSDVDYAMEIVREKIYRRLNQELPYTIRHELVSWNDSKEILYLHFNIHVKSTSIQKMVVGKSGEALLYIKTGAQDDLSSYFKKKVVVYLYIKVASSYFK